MGFDRIDDFREEERSLASGGPDKPSQLPGSSKVTTKADFGVGGSEFRLGGRETKVTGKTNAEPGTHGVSVDSGNRDLWML
jgi:hypothetical protein